MAVTSNRLTEALTAKARSTLGIRFGRFAVAAIAAFVTTEVVLTICAGPLHLSATWASLIAWFSGALISYILSRWAWERKGKPNLVREPLPFWAVSVGAAVVLTLAAKYANHEALRMGMSHVARVLFERPPDVVQHSGENLIREGVEEVKYSLPGGNFELGGIPADRFDRITDFRPSVPADIPLRDVVQFP